MSALLHQLRRPRTRFDKRADVHEVFMKIGCAMIVGTEAGPLYHCRHGG
jgi:hypothetical protein